MEIQESIAFVAELDMATKTIIEAAVSPIQEVMSAEVITLPIQGLVNVKHSFSENFPKHLLIMICVSRG